MDTNTTTQADTSALAQFVVFRLGREEFAAAIDHVKE